MSVTSPTCHLERSPLKALAVRNTAPHIATKKSPRIKMGWEKKEERAFSKINMYQCDISATKKKEKRNGQKERPDLGEGEEECTYSMTCQSLPRPAMRRDHR